MKPELAQAVDLLHGQDASAVNRGVELLQRTVFAFSMKVCGHREDAEDTSQDVLLRALPYLPKFASPQALAVWLYKAARNRCVSARRRSKFAPSQAQQLSLDALMPDGRELEELIAADQPTAEASLLTSEASDRVRKAVLRLPPVYRLVLVLHDMEGLDTAEVARILDVREGTVRVRLHRARLFLRRELARPQGQRKAAATAPKREPRCRNLFAALSDYLDGLVDDAACAQMQQHLSDCRPCQAFIHSLEKTVEQCRAYQPECAPERSGAIREQLVRQYLQAVEALEAQTSRKRGRARTARH